MLKVILFDWDGTCHDSVGNIKAAFMYAKEKIGFSATWEDYRLLIGIPTVAQAVKMHPENPDEFVRNYREFYNKTMECGLFPNTKETLENLKEDFVLCLVTSKTRNASMKCLKDTELNHIFDHAVCGDDVTKGKPDPEPILKALEHYKIKPEEALYVGDSAHDINASKAAGVPVIGVTWGALYRNEIEKENPDYIADTWEEVIEICKNKI